MVKMVNHDLHKGGPALSAGRGAAQARRPQRHGQHHHAPTRAVATSTITASSTSVATRTASQRRSGSSEYDPEPQCQHRVAVLRRRRAPLHNRARGASSWARRSRSGSEAPSNQVTRCRCNIRVGTTVPWGRDDAGQGGADGARRRRGRAAARTRGRVRAGAPRPLQRSGAGTCINCRRNDRAGGNEEHNLRVIARPALTRLARYPPTMARGRSNNRWTGPLGGRTRGNRHPTSPWGKPAKGKKTRSNKRTQVMIVRSRHKKT